MTPDDTCTLAHVRRRVAGRHGPRWLDAVAHAHELGALGWRWLAVDVVCACGAGLAIGAAMGTGPGPGPGRQVLYLRRQQAVGYENFLALALIGLDLRRTEQAIKAPTQPAEAERAHAVLSFNDQLDRIGETAGVVMLGLLLWAVPWVLAALWFVPLALLLVLPLSVALGLASSRRTSATQRGIGWFGIRSIGSLYYLGYALKHGLPAEQDVGVGGDEGGLWMQSLSRDPLPADARHLRTTVAFADFLGGLSEGQVSRWVACSPEFDTNRRKWLICIEATLQAATTATVAERRRRAF